MRHFASGRYWHCFEALPRRTQTLASRNFALLKENPAHPSLQFKSVCQGRFRCVRIGLGYQALGVPVPDGVQWFWIGSHAEYDRLIGP